jgi:hypothetical protein
MKSKRYSFCYQNYFIKTVKNTTTNERLKNYRFRPYYMPIIKFLTQGLRIKRIKILIFYNVH